MSAVTLEKLAADFEAKAKLYGGPFLHEPGPESWELATYERWLEFAEPFWTSGSMVNKVAREAYIAGTLYVIARDHGLNAAMLYKLSDGGHDPREVS